MQFTQKQFNDLCKTYINNEEIIITGCNYYAQEFTTTGKISSFALTDSEKNFNDCDYAIALNHETLFLEFGKRKQENVPTDYVAPFVTDLYVDDLNNFIIKDITIKHSKKIIYNNESYNEYYAWARQELIARGKTLIRHNITPAEMHPTCQKLTKHIGKPINAFGETGVLFIVDHYNKGIITLYVLDETDLKEITIPANANISEGRTLLKISEGTQKETFQDYLLNLNKK